MPDKLPGPKCKGKCKANDFPYLISGYDGRAKHKDGVDIPHVKCSTCWVKIYNTDPNILYCPCCRYKVRHGTRQKHRKEKEKVKQKRQYKIAQQNKLLTSNSLMELTQT